MATGVPKRRGNVRRKAESQLRVRLEYAGRQTERAILSGPGGESRVVWEGDSGSKNRLYFGENLGVLAALGQDRSVRGKVRLVYIDPPFSTQAVYHSRTLRHAYEDTMVGPEFVEFLRQRLVWLRELMATDGSIYVHLDSKMVSEVKLIMDEVFGPKNFRNLITRRKCNSKNYTRLAYGNVADYILFYTKSGDYVWNRPVEPWTEERAREYQYVDEASGRRFMKVPVHAPGVRRGETGKPWRGTLPPPGKHWQFSPAKLDEMDVRGEIVWSENGNPRRKVFLDASAGVGTQDIWMDFRDAHNQNVCITGYPTEKNPALLRRIVAASSNAGDLVLDCFAGSGTTLAVAGELGRRWIGVDKSVEAVGTTLRRFARGTRRMGDFVGARRAKRRAEPQAILSLFGSEVGEEARSLGAEAAHQPITNFTLYASGRGRGALASVLREWKKLIAEGESLLGLSRHN